MRRFQTLLTTRVHVRIPGMHIHTFALHRHRPTQFSVEPHGHGWSQAILYIGGLGSQIFGDTIVPVEPGTLVVFPPDLVHGFQRTTNRLPLCLMIDFYLKGARAKAPAIYKMNRSELIQVRQQLAYLLKLRSRASDVLNWESASVALQLLISLLRVAGWLRQVPELVHELGDTGIHRLLSSMDVTVPLQRIVQQSGYQRDHLNRLVKKETGLSLGQFRTQQRLIKAKELLSHGIRVANVADAIGIPDQSYFSRWFRQLTGQVPSFWFQRDRASKLTA
jgi:AraC family L-rhamnose operon transcriptional activator RhaR